MNMKSVLVTTGIAVAIVLGAVSLVKPIKINVSPTPVQVNIPEQKAPIVNVQPSAIKVNNVPVPVSVPAPTFGAVPSLDGVDSKFVRIGGLGQAWGSIPMSATSSILCSFQNPYPATSTVNSFTANFKSGVTGANVFYLSTSTNAYGSSTLPLVAAFPLATGSKGSLVWQAGIGTSTSVVTGAYQTTDGSSAVFLRPGEFLNLRLATSSAGTLSPGYTGACKTIIQSLD